MRILWITNKICSKVSNVAGLSNTVFGGWICGLAKHLNEISDIHLAMALPYSGNKLDIRDIGGVKYYFIPSKSIRAYQKSMEAFWKEICIEFRPDLVHVHGTEYVHGLSCMRVCPDLNFIISIQGMISIISRYYFADIPVKELIYYITFRDIWKADTLFHQKRNFIKRGQYEREYINRTKHVIGRTRWDYAHVKSVNPQVNYHMCNEMLRESFYSAGKWSIDTKQEYLIFISQANYPIKGLHQVLKAVAKLKSSYPAIRIRVAGPNFIENRKIRGLKVLTGYGAYILHLIKTLKLYDNIEFTGILTEEQMVLEFQNAHVFVCPSSIENSPNSVGEAQIIGVPVIAAYVGGVPDMVSHFKTGLLYRFEEVEMLTEFITNIFDGESLCRSLSENEIKVAEERHARGKILKNTIDIYKAVL